MGAAESRIAVWLLACLLLGHSRGGIVQACSKLILVQEQLHDLAGFGHVRKARRAGLRELAEDRPAGGVRDSIQNVGQLVHNDITP